jgi:predicted RNA-binding Zn-ribbon protein involved in translation (DUF1610 family)
MAVKYQCPKCEKRYIDWGAEKLGFQCPDCDEEKLIQVGLDTGAPAKAKKKKKKTAAKAKKKKPTLKRKTKAAAKKKAASNFDDDVAVLDDDAPVEDLSALEEIVDVPDEDDSEGSGTVKGGAKKKSKSKK